MKFEDVERWKKSKNLNDILWHIYIHFKWTLKRLIRSHTQVSNYYSFSLFFLLPLPDRTKITKEWSQQSMRSTHITNWIGLVVGLSNMQWNICAFRFFSPFPRSDHTNTHPINWAEKKIWQFFPNLICPGKKGSTAVSKIEKGNR